MAETSLISQDQDAINNSLSTLVQQLSPYGGMYGPSEQINQSDTMFRNVRGYLISNFRQLLSQMYAEHGIVQTLVDQPVMDAFRTGYDFKTKQLSPDEIKQLHYFMEMEGVNAAAMQGKIWSRLFGGGGVVVITDQNPATPFRLKDISKDTPLAFKSFDMWEMYYNSLHMDDQTLQSDANKLKDTDSIFNYYAVQVHRSRLLLQKGKTAPSMIRPRLRGWGMSEVERIVRSINMYIKNQDVVFELLDEAKIDIYKIKGLNTNLVNSQGTEKVSKRLQYANFIKNYNNALVMDLDDQYEQKSMSFTGLPDMLIQIRQGLAADLKMPMTKLFGISAAGFSSGDEDIENYNSMCESEVRHPMRPQIVELGQICCMKLFGFVPDDLTMVWRPMRILSAKEEEEVKEKKFDRVMMAFDKGLITPQEAKQSINHDNLLPIEVNESTGALTPPGQKTPGAQPVKKDAERKPGDKSV